MGANPIVRLRDPGPELANSSIRRPQGYSTEKGNSPLAMDCLDDRLAVQFDGARPDLAALLDTLHDDVLPQLQLELALPDPDAAWLDEWFSDIGKPFSPSHPRRCTTHLQLRSSAF